MNFYTNYKIEIDLKAKIEELRINTFPNLKHPAIIIKAINDLYEGKYQKEKDDNDNLRDTLKYTQKFALQSVRYNHYSYNYKNEHNGSLKGAYISYLRTPSYRDASKILWNYFIGRDGIVKCTKCLKQIKVFQNHINSDNSFAPHHHNYKWELLWFPFIDNEQYIFPYHNKCHK